MPDLILYAASAGWGSHDVRSWKPAPAGRDALLVMRPQIHTANAWGAHDVRVYYAKYPELVAVVEEPPGEFPTQFAGLRAFYNAAMRELCLVAAADAATGMGGVPRINKAGTVYAIYLVETSDPDASSVRLSTTTGTKAIRLKT